jgi:hypothetical protein
MAGLPLRVRVQMLIGLAFAIGCAATFASGYDRSSRSSRVTPTHGSFGVLGFELGRTKVGEVERWAHDRGIECTTKQQRAFVECGRVPASMLGESAMLGATGMWFRFDTTGTLASVQTARRGRDVSSIAGAFDRLSSTLAMRAGAPLVQTGGGTPVELSSGASRDALVEFRTAEFRAVVRATNLGGDGFVLTEDYARAD